MTMTNRNTEIKSGDTVASRTVMCTLNRSEDFVSTLELRAVDALPNQAEVLVSSQWLRARNPEGRQVRFKAVVDVEDLQTIAQGIGQFLEDEQTKNKGKQPNE